MHPMDFSDWKCSKKLQHIFLGEWQKTLAERGKVAVNSSAKKMLRIQKQTIAQLDAKLYLAYIWHRFGIPQALLDSACAVRTAASAGARRAAVSRSRSTSSRVSRSWPRGRLRSACASFSAASRPVPASRLVPASRAGVLHCSRLSRHPFPKEGRTGHLNSLSLVLTVRPSVQS